MANFRERFWLILLCNLAYLCGETLLQHSDLTFPRISSKYDFIQPSRFTFPYPPPIPFSLPQLTQMWKPQLPPPPPAFSLLGVSILSLWLIPTQNNTTATDNFFIEGSTPPFISTIQTGVKTVTILYPGFIFYLVVMYPQQMLSLSDISPPLLLYSVPYPLNICNHGIHLLCILPHMERHVYARNSVPAIMLLLPLFLTQGWGLDIFKVIPWALKAPLGPTSPVVQYHLYSRYLYLLSFWIIFFHWCQCSPPPMQMDHCTLCSTLTMADLASEAIWSTC